jgi:hypothetical protein
MAAGTAASRAAPRRRFNRHRSERPWTFWRWRPHGALIVKPNLMQALIWEQSGGEPWSFSLPGERSDQHQVFSRSPTRLRTASGLLPIGAKALRPSANSTSMPVGNRQQVLQVKGLNGCGRLAAMLSIGGSYRRQFRVLAMADAELDAPTEDHAGRDIVAPANRRGTDARLFGLHHDHKLLRVGEAAPVRPSIARRSGSRGVCQAVFDQLSLSSAASITAYRRTDTGMKTRTPVDLHTGSASRRARQVRRLLTEMRCPSA